jgi:circadian clock protein KaiC
MPKVTIETLQTGVQGLDTLLGGGISKYSFNVITGAPGSGKTTLAHQIMFSLVAGMRKALYFTIVGEPPLKMLRYQQQYLYFDNERVGSSIKYLNLADDLHTGGFEGVLDRILREVEQFQPELVFVDSFKSVVHAAKGGSDNIADLQFFVQRLGMHMASWQATTFLIGEYPHAEEDGNPVFTVADGVIHLSQEIDGNAIVRKIRVVKMRGIRHMLGSHIFRITGAGIRVFPRLLTGGIIDSVPNVGAQLGPTRLSTGSPELDEMLGGGIPAGYSVLLVGPPGAGKTIFSAAFLAEGVKAGQSGVLASFEHIVSSYPSAILDPLIASGKVTAIRPSSLDLSLEEVVLELMDAVDRIQAKRVVIDSLSALELALAPQFRHNFEESLFRMLAAFSRKGVTVLMIRSTEGAPTSRTYRPSGSFLVDCVISMHYAEMGSTLVKLISSDKLRGSWHSPEIRSYGIHENGIVVSKSAV